MTTEPKSDKNICLIVPTIRENCLRDFVERWNKIGLFNHVDLVVMEDNPAPTFDIMSLPSLGEGSKIVHLSWLNIREMLRVDEWIIPRRSDTVRSFAYWYAWSMGYEYLLTLDDDCYPPLQEDGLQYDGAGFINEHLKWLNSRTRWFNTLNSVKPRGIPFYNLGNNTRTIVNHGLWTNVLDYDAPFQLANPIPEQFAFDNRIVPAGSYFPMCGMNVMWKADATVLMYHLLMGQQIKTDGVLKSIAKDVQDPQGELTRQYIPLLNKLPFDRFGDIWCGIFMKKIADDMKLSVSTGMPCIRHERASNPFTNLKKEANGIEVNEKLWEYVDSFNTDGNSTLAAAYYSLGKHIANFDAYPEYKEYFLSLGQAMQIWSSYFTK